jgi:hypothetical protein
MLLGLAPDAWYASLLVIGVATIGFNAINSAQINIGLGQLASTALQSLTELPGEIIQPAIEQMNQLRERVKEEVNKRKPDLDKLHLIIQPFTAPQGTPQATHLPPLGSPQFLIMEQGGTNGRVLGARLAFRDKAARKAPGGNQLCRDRDRSRSRSISIFNSYNPDSKTVPGNKTLSGLTP